MRSVTLKSAITPSFMGRIATMFPGVRPTISLASLPTASTSPLVLLMATMDGSFTTTPLLLAKTSVFAVPRSMARSEEIRLKTDLKFMKRAWSLTDRDPWMAAFATARNRAQTLRKKQSEGEAPPAITHESNIGIPRVLDHVNLRFHRLRGQGVHWPYEAGNLCRGIACRASKNKSQSHGQ